MAPRRITIGDIIGEHSRSYPGKLALADGDYRATWARNGRAVHAAG